MSFTSAKSRPTRTFDALLEMKDAGLVAASAAATVDGAAKVLDCGTGFFEGDLIIDVTAIEVATGDEGYTITIEGSSDSGFSSGVEVELAKQMLGDSSITGSDVDNVAGRYTLPFNNRQPSGTGYPDGTCWRYIRVYTTVVGSIATGINYSAWIAPKG